MRTLRMPMKSDNLSMEELTDAADEFFSKFDFIMTRCPDGTSVKDILRVMDVVVNIGYVNRDRRTKVVGFIGPEGRQEVPKDEETTEED